MDNNRRNSGHHDSGDGGHRETSSPAVSGHKHHYRYNANYWLRNRKPVDYSENNIKIEPAIGSTAANQPVATLSRNDILVKLPIEKRHAIIELTIACVESPKRNHRVVVNIFQTKNVTNDDNNKDNNLPQVVDKLIISQPMVF
ncbi:uncharacterized protein LOC128956089 [Oppia nitens]|uniref:uncharacterized protein LOC128956089 n=1 Tax=Oppia nitens TaxID=1686743 RepID=UPI0023DA6C0A|nr:uncharacterized protein LOC128956089 [Oppia nitens]